MNQFQEQLTKISTPILTIWHKTNKFHYTDGDADDDDNDNDHHHCDHYHTRLKVKGIVPSHHRQKL